jgi:hypothetical protein
MEDEFFIDQLVRHTGGKKVLWSFVFNGRRCVLTTHQLMTQSQFRLKVCEAVNRFPPRRAPINFERYIGNLMRNCVERDTGPD